MSETAFEERADEMGISPSTPLVIERAQKTGDGKEPCPECGKRYVPGPGMGVHRASAHGTRRGTRRKPCPECGKVLGSKDLARHRRDLHGVERSSKLPVKDLSAEQITRTAAEMLWPEGVPHDKLEVLMQWNTQTARFLALAQG